ncbi:EcoAI/FtnUII family type I restriction enzme subunit R [Methanosarcina sp.]|uniref:EcoAI/FtnUII family type I restriction enzme subunit R n=1 Tax=Methanosarcina sp. TaxID=2213 RepID=UPI002BDD2DBF|nr:DEAD/DEAH box helicase family protein [Methanosarcina sp.]HOW15871.1 DEAD/DEAH box helicase family protein [Methanosarcina sp.]
MEEANKKELSERDICSKFITPAIKQANWKERQIREEVNITKGRIIVKGSSVSRGKPKRADYILSYKSNIPLAVVEAKRNIYTVGEGMQQALTYAEMLGIPFAFSSNGDAFLLHDRTGTLGKIEEEISLDRFPSPEYLWQKYCEWKGLDEGRQKIVTQDYFADFRKPLRYYQRIAINRTVEAIAKGQDRILLVMATGTGKTLTAFQIIWRLWKAGVKKRILFLADRNILVDQTRINDFKHFGNAMTKIQNREAEKSYEIYLSLYQAVSGTEEEKNIYKQFSPDFFDLVIVDECHRGSAAEDSAWREILEYFSSATQIGLTATPKETKDISNIHYFGEPIYTYSLKQGIEDGFLAPYRVVRIDLDKDLEGWRPEKGKTDKYGRQIEDRIYNQKDFDRDLVLEKRTELVAKKVTEFLKANDRFDKTIVFCENIDHAERMREALVNENPDLAGENRKYVMRITGDNQEGKAELDNFISPESRYPVIATTSKLMSTGVDAQTCKLIVLDKRIQSMTEFKQIIGRGTRINEDYGKFYFTIMDFKKATELFADPDFDGEPVEIYVPGGNGNGGSRNPEGETDREKYFVDDVGVEILTERTQYYGPDGKLITESLKDYTRKTMLKDFESLDSFLKHWNEAEKKQVIIAELEEKGILLDALSEEVGKDFDPFDLICHVAFDRPPLSRKERAEKVKKSSYFSKYGEQAQEVLDALLDKYADDGIENLENMSVLKVQPFDRIGTPLEIVKLFGGKSNYLAAVRGLESQLYTQEA